ncbi:MAG: hypothetical protein ACOX1L_09235 [Erysipelotrichaceae bacterium]
MLSIEQEYSIKALVDAGVNVNCLYQDTAIWDQDKEGQELVSKCF